MLVYLKANDFQAVGELTEANALHMHQTTSTANPPFSYLTDASYQAMDEVKSLRASGEQCYFTMDAGPNVKVLCLEKDLDRLADISVRIIRSSFHAPRSCQMPKQSVSRARVKTGGKLYIAGEYSVLTPEQTALIQFSLSLCQQRSRKHQAHSYLLICLTIVLAVSQTQIMPSFKRL